MNFFLSVFFSLFTLYSSITDSIDNINPSIKLHSPLELSECYPGGRLLVSAELMDDRVLDSYQLKIIKGGTSSLYFVECFSCNHLVGSELDALGNAIPKIEGKKSVKLTFHIGIDKSAIVGDYYFFIEVKDKSGNKCEKKVNFTVCRNRVDY